MEKPRILIADTDANYVIPLQMKFVEELFDQVELEIITDRSYFAQLFSSPQKVDILIISEDLYSKALHRHNIGRVFLMVERQEDGSTAELNVVRLYKYTSIKKIYSEIAGISADTLDINSASKKEPQIITISSACGGAGKTTVALGISACLARQYKRVLYIGADRLQSFQRLLENPASISSTDVYSSLNSDTRNAYAAVKHVIRKEGFSYLPPFRVALLSMGLQYSVFERIAVAARDSEEYDYVIVDTDTAFDEDKAHLMNISDKVIVVTRQTANAVYATNLLVENINAMNSEKFLFVCNDFDRSRENVLVNSDMQVKFTPSEYIVHMEDYDEMKCADFAKSNSMQKIAVLVI